MSEMPGKISDYRLDGYIGRGRLADVYRAHDERMGRTAAVKILTSAVADDAAFRARFVRETQATGEIGHPNIIPVYEVGDMGGLLYAAMLYVQGGDAGSLVARAGPLPADRAWSIIASVASALDAAHAHGLIHRDVKPSNVLVDTGQGQPGSDGGALVAVGRDGSAAVSHVYLSDFGIGSPSLPAGAGQGKGQPAGAPDFDYVSPEQIAGQDADGRADLYSLACVGYYLLCGSAPYGQEPGMAAMRAHLHARPPTATAQRPDLPAAADIVLATALAKNPADRYPTCADFAAELQEALGLGASEPGGSRLLPSPGAAGQPVDMWPAYGAAGAAAAAAAAGPKPAQALGPVLVGPDGPEPPAGPAGPGPRSAFPGADDPFPEPPGWYREPPDAPGSDDFPAALGLYREPGRSYRDPGGRYPGTGGPVPDETYPLPKPGGPSRQPGGPSLQPGGPSRQPGGPSRQPGGPSRQPGGRYPKRSRRGRQIVVGSAVAVVVVAVVVVAAVVLSRAPQKAASSPGSPKAASSPASARASAAPTPSSAAAQAAAVNNLLSASAAARSSLAAAVAQVRKCASVPAAVSQLQSVVKQRTTQVSQASALSTAALANGAAVKSDLLAALRISLTADSDYLTWAQQEQPACKPGATTAAYNAAIGADSQAVTAKQTFVGVWNPVAATYGLPKQSTATF